jgi:hypothetical protein
MPLQNKKVIVMLNLGWASLQLENHDKLCGVSSAHKSGFEGEVMGSILCECVSCVFTYEFCS